MHIQCDNSGQYLNAILKIYAEISGKYSTEDTAHLEISVSFVHVLQDIVTNVHDELCVTFFGGVHVALTLKVCIQTTGNV